MTRPHDFDLFITQSNDSYNVQARAARVGESPAQPLTLPFDLARLPDKRRDVAEWIKYARETRLRSREELRDARAFGKALFDSLFTNEMLAAFRASRSNLLPNERLRLRLRLPPTLMALPWELLYDEYTTQFLALAPDLTLIRYPEMPSAGRYHGPLNVYGPLQVVAVLASPQDDDFPELRLDRELGRLERALALLRNHGQVQLEVIRGPGTLDQLRERLRQPAHILHILSHGDLNPETGEGELLFEDTDGAAEAVNAELLRQYLERQRGQVQLITLNSCLGALPVGNDPFSSVGLALIRSGVPAVVAMQFEIAEDVAAELTRVVYAELAAGVPIDRALSEARLHIFGRYRTRLDWAIPVLFSRAETGVLFKFAPPSGEMDQSESGEPTTIELELNQGALKHIWHRALAAFYMKNWQQAEVLLMEVVNTDPNYEDVQAKLNETRLKQRLQVQYRQLRELRDSGQWQAVLNVLNELEQDEPNYPDPDGHRQWAEAHWRCEQQYDAALVACDQRDWLTASMTLNLLLNEFPDNEDAQILMATVQRHIQEQKCQQRRDELYRTSQRNIEWDEWDTGRKTLEKLLFEFPDDAEAWALLADVKAKLQEQERQKRRDDQYGAALREFKRNKLLETQEALEKLLSEFPDDTEAQLLLSDVKTKLQEWKHQKRRDELYRKAQTAFDHSNWKVAEEVLTKLLNDFPDDRDVRELLAKTRNCYERERRKPGLTRRKRPVRWLLLLSVGGIVTLLLVIGFMIPPAENERIITVANIRRMTSLGDISISGREIYSVAFSPDGQTLASGTSDNVVRIWSLDNHRRLLHTLEGHSDDVRSVAFSPDGQTLASGSDDNDIKLWNVADYTFLGTLEGHSGDVRSVVFSPDGQTLASGSTDNTVKLWHMGSLRLRRTLEEHNGDVYSVAFSPDGQTLASGSEDSSIRLWDVRTGGLRLSPLNHNDDVGSVSFSSDGQIIASGSWDRTVRLWQQNGNLIRRLSGYEKTIESVSFSPNGQILASGAWDGTVKLWDTEDWRLLRTLNFGEDTIIRCVTFSEDGTLFAAALEDGSIRLWGIQPAE